MLPSLTKISNVTTIDGKRKASSFTSSLPQTGDQVRIQLQKIKDMGDVSYATLLKDAFDAYAAIVLYAKSMSRFILQMNREKPDATRLFKERTERSGTVWTEAIRQILQDTLDQQELAVWNVLMGYEQTHHWMAALFLFLNSTDMPEVTTELQPYMHVPENDEERRALIEDLLKYDGSFTDGPKITYLDNKLLNAMYEGRVVGFDIALRKRLALNLDHLLDNGVRMFGVTLDAPITLFRADDRPGLYEITDISTALRELSATVVSTSTRHDIDTLFCKTYSTAGAPPCIVYKFHIASGTNVLPVTVDHPLLEAPLIDRKFLPYSMEEEVLLPKQLTYELQSTAPKTGKTRQGRSTIIYSVNVSLR